MGPLYFKFSLTERLKDSKPHSPSFLDHVKLTIRLCQLQQLSVSLHRERGRARGTFFSRGSSSISKDPTSSRRSRPGSESLQRTRGLLTGAQHTRGQQEVRLTATPEGVTGVTPGINQPIYQNISTRKFYLYFKKSKIAGEQELAREARGILFPT